MKRFNTIAVDIPSKHYMTLDDYHGMQGGVCMKSVITYVICVVLVEASGFAVGMATRNGTQIYADTINKPPLSPPGIVFPIAWTILYALMGIGFARVLLSDGGSYRSAGIVLFVIQLVLNLALCFIFFGAQRFGIALAELIVMLITVIAMAVSFSKCDKAACYMQIPYILWLCFATYLNTGVVILN